MRNCRGCSRDIDYMVAYTVADATVRDEAEDIIFLGEVSAEEMNNRRQFLKEQIELQQLKEIALQEEQKADIMESAEDDEESANIDTYWSQVHKAPQKKIYRQRG